MAGKGDAGARAGGTQHHCDEQAAASQLPPCRFPAPTVPLCQWQWKQSSTGQCRCQTFPVRGRGEGVTDARAARSLLTHKCAAHD